MGTLLRGERVRRTVHEIQRLTRQSTADHVFLDELAGLLREVVPFEAAFWAAADPVTTLATSPALIDGFPSDDTCHRAWQAEFLVEDVNRFSTLARAASPVSSLYQATRGQPTRSFRYRSINREHGLGDDLRGVFRAGGGVWGMVSLWRGDGDKPFSPAEIQLLTSLSTSVADTFRRSALLHGRDVLDLPDSLGLLVLDQSGAVESMNDTAELWLAELPPPRFSLRNGAVPVPTELLVVASRARAAAAGQGMEAPRVRVLSRRGRWLTVHGFVLREPTREISRTAVVIELAKAADTAPIMLGAYQLAPREQEVSQLVARGLATVEIAAALHLSVHTVRDYLKQVFEKVGVSSRGELVATIFAEQGERNTSAIVDAPHDRNDDTGRHPGRRPGAHRAEAGAP